MASIKYLLQSNSSQANIYVRLSLGRGKDFKRRTGYTIDSKNWSKAKGMPIQRNVELSNLKQDLLNLSSNLGARLNEAIRNRIDVNANWLQKELEIINNKTPVKDLDLLTNYIQLIIDTAASRMNQRGELGLSERRIKGYKTFKGMIKTYEKEVFKGESIILKNVDAMFANNFQDWLFSKRYSINYVGKNIDNLKAVCNDAEKNGYRTSPSLKNVRTFSKQKIREEIIYLTEEEQNQIAQLELKREALMNARKWLLLGCLIGQRGSDLLVLTEENIKELEEFRIIELVQQKTGKKVAIPLLPQAEKVIEGGMPYSISLQKFNKYIKDICEQSKINEPSPGRKNMEDGIFPKFELIGSHVCRRSFATNFYGKIPTSVLINITGHGTEKMFLKYIGKSSYDSAKQMVESFNKLQHNLN